MQQMQTPGSHETEVLLSEMLLGGHLNPILCFLCSFRAGRRPAVLFCFVDFAGSCSILQAAVCSCVLVQLHAHALILAWTTLLSF